jgi:hypothetical protein
VSGCSACEEQAERRRSMWKAVGAFLASFAITVMIGEILTIVTRAA